LGVVSRDVGLFQAVDMLLSRLLQFFQRRLAAKRAASRAGPHEHADLSDRFQRHDAAGRESVVRFETGPGCKRKWIIRRTLSTSRPKGSSHRARSL
jgi:hypothetical protein